MIRAVIYCRCSTEEESQQDALFKQAAESRLSVARQGWLLVDEYIEAKSGTTTAGRDEYNRLYEELQTDKFDIVVIKSQDRLMRNTKDWYLFIDRLVTNGKKLFMYLEDKFYSADDALITGIKAILAEEYSRELSKKINNAHYYRQRDGRKFILPSRTYGLKRNPDGSVELQKEEAEAIRIMFFLCKSMGCTSIGRYLEENGIRDRNGKVFQAETIRRIIRNPIRCGTVIQNKRHFDFQTGRTMQVPKDQWMIHKNAVPAIVPEQEWQEANEAMDRRKRAYSLNEDQPRGKNPGKYRLSGKIRCGECGSPYYRRYRKKQKKTTAVWQCRNYIHNGRNLAKQDCKNSRETEPEEGRGCNNIHLDEERLSAILEKAAGQYSDVAKADVSEITGIIMQILTETLEQDDPAGQVKHLKKEAERYAGQKQRLLEKLLEDVITDEDYKEKRTQIEQKMENINHQLEKLNDAGSTQNIPEQRLEKIQKRLADGAVRQAEIEVMLDYIEEIEVFPSRLVLTCKPEMHGAEKNPRIEIPLDADFQYASRKESENQRILDYMHDNPRITAKMIAEKEGISLSAANARIRRLKRQGRIHYNGKGGHGEWKVRFIEK